MFLFEFCQHFLCFLHAPARRSPLPARPPRPQKRWQVRSTVLAEFTEASVSIFTPGSSALWRKEVETRAQKPGFLLFKSAKWSTFCTFCSGPPPRIKKIQRKINGFRAAWPVQKVQNLPGHWKSSKKSTNPIKVLRDSCSELEKSSKSLL